MNGLSVFNFNQVDVVDSREVAKLVDVRHADLLEKIGGYIRHLTNGKFRSLDFFILSTYQDSKGENRPNYLITKKGCDMIANKTTGKKGVLFTAAYVTAFEEMRQALTAAPVRVSFPEGVSLSGMARLISITRRAMLDAGSTPLDVCGMIKETYEAVGFPVPTVFPKQFPGQISLFDTPALS